MESWQTCLLGKGTGLLTAASLALSSNLNELAKFGAIVVGIAFRTGLMVERMSGSVEVLDRSTQSPEPWLVCVHGLTEEEVQAEVEKYNTLRVCSFLLATRELRLSLHRISQSIVRYLCATLRGALSASQARL